MLMLAMFATSFISCDKDEDEDQNVSDNSWVINGLTYKTATLSPPTFSGNNLAATSTDNGGGAVGITFSTKPTANKVYTVVLGTATPTADECKITVLNTNDPKTFLSTGRSGDKVNVTVSGGKVTATITNVEMLYLVGSTENKTTISGKLIEG